MKAYCVYSHSIGGVVFYIGCCKLKKNFEGFRDQHGRVYLKSKRPQHWKDYVAGRDYDCSILSYHDTQEEGFAEEIRLIGFFGRIDLGTGTLVNKAPGGYCHPDGPLHRAVGVVQMDLNGNKIREWACVRHIEQELGFLKTNVVKCCRKKQVTAYGFTWAYKDCRDFDNITPSASRNEIPRPSRKPVYDKISMQNFASKLDAAQALNINISTVLRNRSKRFVEL